MKKTLILCSAVAGLLIGAYGLKTNATLVRATSASEWAKVGGDVAEVSDIEGGVAFNLSGWNSSVFITEKVALNGLEFTVSNIDDKTTPGFYFTQNAEGAKDEGKPFFTLWNGTWIAQGRLLFAPTHDYGANCCYSYKSMDDADPSGLSAAGGHLVLNEVDDLALTFKFELVSAEWFKVTIKDENHNAIWGDVNYNAAGGDNAYTYVKTSDLNVDANGEAYLGFWCVDKSTAQITNFTNGEKVNFSGWTKVAGEKAEVSKVEEGYAFDLAGWNSQMVKDEKVILNGLEFTLTNIALGTTPGFYFTDTPNGQKSEEKPFVTIWNGSWTTVPSQCRLLYTNTHDPSAGSGVYKSMDDDAPYGMSGAGGHLVMNTSDNLTLKFHFDRIDADWYKLTIYDLTNSLIWGDPNYNSTPATSAFTYIKSSDLSINEDGEAYLGIWCVDQTQVKMIDFTNGEFFKSVTDTNWSLIAGDASGNTAMTDLNGTQFVMNGWQAGFYYNKEKVCANGFEITLSNLKLGNQDIFHFGESTESTQWSGPVISVWNAVSFAPSQCRVQIALNHDPSSGSICYKDTKDASASGLSGANSLVIDAVDNLSLKFKFERINFGWWKVTITNLTNCFWTDVNYNISEDAKSCFYYIKNADFALGEQDSSYLHVATAGASNMLVSFKNGSYVEFSDVKGDYNALCAEIDNMSFVGFPESYNDEIAAFIAAAKEELAGLEYESEMKAVVEGLRAKIVTAYNSTVYTESATSFDGVAVDANFEDTWGQGVKANRLSDEGTMLGLANGWGTRGHIIRKYDAKNFEISFNLSKLAVGEVLIWTASANNANSYATEDKVFSFDIYKGTDRDYSFILSNTGAHNVSLDCFKDTETFHPDYAGKNVVSDSGDFVLSFTTVGNETTVKVNDVAVTFDSSLLYANYETEQVYTSFSFGCINSNGVTPVCINYIRDAASIEYVNGLSAAVEKAQSELNAACQEIAGKSPDEVNDETYNAWNEAYEKFTEKVAEIKAGLDSYDYNHYVNTSFYVAIRQGNNSIAKEYATKLENAKASLAEYFATIDIDAYRAAEQEAINTAYATASEAVAAGENLTTVETAIATFKAVVEGSKTNAQLKAEEDLAAYKTTKKAELSALLAEAEEDAITDVAKLISEGNSKIDAAENNDAIDSIVNEYKSSIAAINAKIVAAREELANARFSAIKEIEDVYESLDLTKYETENVVKLQQLLEEATAAIDSAADISAISTLVANFKTNVAAVPVIASGCGNSVIASTAIVTLVSLLGVCFLFSKKEK